MTDGAPDAWLGGRLTLRQPDRREGHRAGTDALLLAAAVTPSPDALVCDVGASTGAVGLALAARCPDCRLVLVERDPGLCALAVENVAQNALGARVTVAQADISGPAAARQAAGLPAGTADLVLTNPPYLDPARHRASNVPGRAAAHVLAEGGLPAWIAACTRLLRPGGRFVVIHRADALADLLAAVGTRVGSLRVLPIHPRAGAPATRILVVGTKGGRSPTALLPGLVLHGPSGAFAPEIAAIQRGDAALNL